MDRRAKPSLFLLGHWLPACLNFWHYNWERCIMSIRKTSWSHAFCFIFKPLTSKNIENKWSISKTLIFVCCVYLIYWPNKYVFTISFFMHPQYISLQWSYEILQWLSVFGKAFSGSSESGLEVAFPYLYSSAPGAQQKNLLIVWLWFGMCSVGKTKGKNFNSGTPQRN